MDERVVRSGRISDRAWRRNRNAAEVDGEAGDLFGDRAAEVLQRKAAKAAAEAEKARRVLAFLHDEEAGLPHDDQRAVGLNRSGEMDLLLFAIRDVCGSKSERLEVFSRHDPTSGARRFPTTRFPTPMSRPYFRSFACKVWRLIPRLSAASVRFPPDFASASARRRFSTLSTDVRTAVPSAFPNPLRRTRRDRVVDPPLRSGSEFAHDEREMGRPIVLIAGDGDLHLGIVAEFAHERRPQRADRAALLDEVEDSTDMAARREQPALDVLADDGALHAGLNEVQERVIGQLDDAVAIDDHEALLEAPDEGLERKRGGVPPGGGGCRRLREAAHLEEIEGPGLARDMEARRLRR